MTHRLRMRGAVLGVCLAAVAAASCGGGGDPLPAELSVVSITFVTSTDAPLDPTLTALPKNTWIRIEFTKPVDAATINAQSIRVREGPSYASQASGYFEIDGAVVRFDSTRLGNGGPNPFGFPSNTAFRIDLPTVEQAPAAVQSADGDPLVKGLSIDFATSDQYIVERTPPRVLGTRFRPDPGAGPVSSGALMLVDFDETLAPDSLQLARNVVHPGATVDVRYTNAAINVAAGVAGKAVPGQLRLDASGRAFEFRPFFSFGTEAFEFQVRVFDGITDLVGNRLANPSTFGPFVCDGSGGDVGTVLYEDFFTVDDRDTAETDTDWGIVQPGVCVPPPVTTREVYILGSTYADDGTTSGVGTYYGFVDPLNGVTINQVVPNLDPPSALGRRVQLTFSDTEVGTAGTITGLAWGPAQNATFVATYEDIRIRAGYVDDTSQVMQGSFSANLPDPVELYAGDYHVPQRANVGNTPGLPFVPHRPGYGSFGFAPCNGALDHNKPLFDYTGFQPWPALHRQFDWTPGSPAPNDSILVLEFEVPEGTDYQAIRSLYGSSAPCSGVLGTMPLRRLLGVPGDDDANPAPTQGGFMIVNPEPTVMDTRISMSAFKTVAQSLFYTPPGDPSTASGGTTFGTDSDYMAAVLDVDRPAATRVQIEYQGATAVNVDRQTIDMGQPFTAWTTNVDDCDGLPYIRWRLRFTGNYVQGFVPTARAVYLPIRDAAGP